MIKGKGLQGLLPIAIVNSILQKCWPHIDLHLGPLTSHLLRPLQQNPLYHEFAEIQNNQIGRMAPVVLCFSRQT